MSFSPRCRKQSGLASSRRLLRKANLWDPSGAKGRQTLIYQRVPSFFFIQTTFRFFRADMVRMRHVRSTVSQLFSARKPTYTHFSRKTTKEFRECTEILSVS